MTSRRRASLWAAAALVLAAAAAGAAPLDEIRASYRRGAYAEAEAAARALLDSTPPPYEAAWGRYLLGRSLERLERPAEAVAAYDAVSEADPSSTLCDDALYLAGRLLEADSPAAAVERYRRAVLLYPEGDFRPRAEERLAVLSRRLSPPAASAPGETAAGRPARAPTVTIQFQDADVRQFIRWVSEATGRNFIIADGVTGNVTIFAGREVPIEEVYPIFLAVLDVKGFALVEGAGGVSKILPRAEAARSEGPIYLGPIADVPPDRIVTRIWRLRRADANTLQGVLRPLISPTDVLAIHPAANALIMTGVVANIGRVNEAIEALDVEGLPLEVEVIRLEHAAAEAVATSAREVVAGMTPPGAAPSPNRILADQRTNSIVVLGTPEVRAAVRDLAARLDADEAERRRLRTLRLAYAPANEIAAKARELFGLDGSAGRGRIVADDRVNVLYLSGSPVAVVEAVERFVALADTVGTNAGLALHVFPLQNADAEDLAPILQGLLTGGEAVTRVSIGQGSTSAAAGGAPPAAGAPATSEAGAEVPAGPVRVIAEPQSNALLVTAQASDYARIRDVIRTLDVRKQQVLVDALILEASLDRVRALGIELNSLDQPLAFHNRALGGTNFGQRVEVVSGAAEGLVGGIFRGSVVGPTIQALQEASDVNVISSPQILAEDNEEAEIFVGDLIPVVTSQVSSSIQVGEGQTGIFQNVEYRNVGVRLKMKPHINEDGYVKMEIEVQVEGIREAAVPNSALRLPSFNQRLVTTRSQVRDGDYVVIGGLISSQEDRRVSKVPILGDIPGLGLLFRRQSVNRDKTNLIIFIRPRLVTAPDVHIEVTGAERMRYEAEANPPRPPDRNDLDRIIPPED